MSKNKEWPTDKVHSMGSQPKQATHIPPEIEITKCPPSKRGNKNKLTMRPRKGGRPISWEVAQAAAPDGDKTYDEQLAKEVTSVRSLSPSEALIEEIMKLKRLADKSKESNES